MHERGFTLIELLITMAIVIVIAGTSFGYYRSFGRAVELNLAQQTLASDLRATQARALAGELDADWGIHLVNAGAGAQNYYQIFSSSSGGFNAAGISSTVYLSPAISFSDPTAGKTKDILFKKQSGSPIDGLAKTMTLQFENKTLSLSVSEQGGIF